MVVFGSPVECEDNAIRAVKTGIKMQKKAKEIDNKLNLKNEPITVYRVKI